MTLLIREPSQALRHMRCRRGDARRSSAVPVFDSAPDSKRARGHDRRPTAVPLLPSRVKKCRAFARVSARRHVTCRLALAQALHAGFASSRRF